MVAACPKAWQRSNEKGKPAMETVSTVSPLSLYDAQTKQNSFVDLAYSFHALGDKIDARACLSHKACEWVGQEPESGLHKSTLT